MFKKPLKVIYIALFIYFLQSSFTVFVNSSFLGTVIPEKMVGIVFTVGSALALLLLSELPNLASNYGNRAVLKGLLLVTIATLIGVLTVTHVYALAIIMAVYISLNAATLMSFDVFLEEYSPKKKLGDVRGVFTALTHIALVVALVLVGIFVGDHGNYKIIYSISLALTGITFLFLVTHSAIFKNPHGITRKPFMKSVRTFWQHTELRKVFLASFILQFFYAAMAIYTPLYLNQNLGISWTHIGLILAITMLPFVFFPIPLGKFADRKAGEKEIMIIGFILMALATAVMSFITTTTWWIWALILFGTRIGASAAHIMTESFFFKHINESNEVAISIFRDANPLAYMLAPIVITLTLLNFNVPIQYLFISLGLTTLLGARYALMLRDTK